MSDNINDPLDRLFRDKLGDQAASGPMGDWPSLEQRVQAQFAKKKRRRFIIYFFLSAVLLTGFWLSREKFLPATGGVSNHMQIRSTDQRVSAAAPVDQPGRPSVATNTTAAGRSEPVIIQDETTANHQPGSHALRITRKKASNKVTENNYLLPEPAISTDPVTSPITSTGSSETVAMENQPKKAIEKKQKPAPASPEQTEEAKESFMWLDIHAGINRTTPVLSGETRQPGYFAKRRTEESAGFYHSFGFNARFKVKRFIGLFGVDIFSYGEKVHYSDRARKRFYSVSGGQYVYVDSVVVNPSFMAQSNNRITYLEFPLYAGYEFPTKGKIGYSVTGGVSLGFLTGYETTYIDTALTGAYVYDNQKKESFQQQGFSVGLQPSLEYRMRSFSELYISVPVRYRLSSVMDLDANTKQRYFSLGLRLGCRFHIK